MADEGINAQLQNVSQISRLFLVLCSGTRVRLEEGGQHGLGAMSSHDGGVAPCRSRAR